MARLLILVRLVMSRILDMARLNMVLVWLVLEGRDKRIAGAGDAASVAKYCDAIVIASDATD